MTPSRAYSSASEWPPYCFFQPRPLLERAGPGQGRVLTSRASRRLDDRDKMATLPGGIQGLYPEALSPEQLEKLRGFKVGAAPDLRLR